MVRAMMRRLYRNHATGIDGQLMDAHRTSGAYDWPDHVMNRSTWSRALVWVW